MVHDGSQREASVVNDNWRCSEVQNILILVLCVINNTSRLYM